jgi:diguanylate cyclase (GGDEF)-like protein
MAAMNETVNADALASDAARQLAVLNRIARIATDDIELRPMLQRIVDALHQAYDWEFVACATVDRTQNRFVCEALYSECASDVGVGYTRELGTGIVGEVALTGRTIDLDDVGGYHNFFDTLHGTRSELCVPVLHKDEVLAVLNVESRRVGAFRGQRVLLETVAEQIGGVIAMARLHLEIRRRADLFQTASELSRAAQEVESFEHTLERIALFIRERFDLELCGIFVAGPDGQLTLRARAGDSPMADMLGRVWTFDRGVVVRAYRTGETQFVPDVHQDADYVPGNARVRCELAVPIRLQGRLLGVINMESARSDSFLGDNRIMLEALAAQVAGAIHLAGSARRLAEMNRLLEQRSLELQSTNAQLRLANAALEKLSQRDGLTGIANRRRFDSQFDADWRSAQQGRRAIGLLLIDVDHFKSYNDGSGHLAGDDALKRVASAIESSLGDKASGVARYGGEEFVALLPGLEPSDCLALAECVRLGVAALDIPHPRAPGARLSVSVGVASLKPARSDRGDSLVLAADRALYRAKHEGRDRSVLAEN